MTAAGQSAPRTSAPDGAHQTLPHGADQAVRAVLSEPGAPLPTAARRDADQRLGYDFSRVRVHTGPHAASSARAVNAAAYTVGSHIVFGAGRYAPDTGPGSRLLTHELTHVSQQARSGYVVVARQPEPAQHTAPDLKVSLVNLDMESSLERPVGALVGVSVVNEAVRVIAREYLRGLYGGLRSIQLTRAIRILQRFRSFGLLDSSRFALGLVVGVARRLALELQGMIEALATLMQLQYRLLKYTLENLPDIMKGKYAQRIQRILNEARSIPPIAADLLRDPASTWKALGRLVVSPAVLTKARQLGRRSIEHIAQLLEEDWYKLGLRVGGVIGRIVLEVVLLVATKGIGNILRANLRLAGRIAGRVLVNVAEFLTRIRGLLGSAIQWLQRIRKTLKGKTDWIYQKFELLLGKLRAVTTEMLGESAIAQTGAGGVRMPIPEPKGAGVLESRARPPRVPVADLYPAKSPPASRLAEQAKQEIAEMAKPEGDSPWQRTVRHYEEKPPHSRISPTTIGKARTKLRNNLENSPDQPKWTKEYSKCWEAHHLIPWSLRNHRALDALRATKEGWDHNGVENGIALPAYRRGDCEFFAPGGTRPVPPPGAEHLPWHQITATQLGPRRGPHPRWAGDLQGHPVYNGIVEQELGKIPLDSAEVVRERVAALLKRLREIEIPKYAKGFGALP